MYKVYMGTLKKLMSEVFPLRQETQHRLRNLADFCIPQVKGLNCGLESITCLGPQNMEGYSFSY